jgi:hypothetical protein
MIDFCPAGSRPPKTKGNRKINPSYSIEIVIADHFYWGPRDLCVTCIRTTRLSPTAPEFSRSPELGAKRQGRSYFLRKDRWCGAGANSRTETIADGRAASDNMAGDPVARPTAPLASVKPADAAIDISATFSLTPCILSLPQLDTLRKMHLLSWRPQNCVCRRIPNTDTGPRSVL